MHNQFSETNPLNIYMSMSETHVLLTNNSLAPSAERDWEVTNIIYNIIYNIIHNISRDIICKYYL